MNRKHAGFATIRGNTRFGSNATGLVTGVGRSFFGELLGCSTPIRFFGKEIDGFAPADYRYSESGAGFVVQVPWIHRPQLSVFPIVFGHSKPQCDQVLFVQSRSLVVAP